MNFKTDINFRKQTLVKLLISVQKHEEEIIKALYNDFKKPAFEAVVSETAYIVSELNHTIKNINKWAKPNMVLPSLLNFPSTDYIYKEPYGKVLIIAPWNYPYQLALCPLIAAVAAGNQVVVKPSELTPNTSSIVAKIISETFDENHVKCVEGGVEITQELLAQRWDYIFFTGSVAVGKIVAKAAAENLTPVTLELGGKNPCIIDATANLKLAAKRIVWGKFLNAGQTCIAPDYLLVSNKIKSNLIELIKILIVTNDIKGIKRFISEGEDINLQDKMGWTALITATFCNDPEIVKILIDAGAKIDLQNNEGKTALDIAKEYDYQEIVELLTTNK